MDPVPGLYAELLRAPDDDTLRGALADAYDERADKARADEERAAFIRAQLALHRLGPPRPRLTGAVRSGGPDYYRVLCGADDARRGDRVDVQDTSTNWRQSSRRILHGLKVTKVEVDDPTLGTAWLTLRADGDSGPYPRAEARRRGAVVDKVMSAHGSELFPLPPALPHGLVPAQFNVDWRPAPNDGGLSVWSLVNTNAAAVLERGFPSRISCSWGYWRWVAHVLAAWWPLADVALRDLPDIQHQHSAQSEQFNLREFTFAGLATGELWPLQRVWVSERAWQANVDQEGTLRNITRDLLRKTWPTVTRWHLPDD